MCVRVLIYPQFCYLKITLIIQKTVQTNEQTKGEREMIHWEVGWHAKLELMSFTHAWEPTNSSSEVVLSNWFYPIMNCEGPADVWDHQCQQLTQDSKEHWRDCLNVHYISRYWWLAGAMYQRMLELIDFQMWQAECVFPPAESPGLVYWWGLWISFWFERKEQDCRKPWDTAWQESFLLKPVS